MLASSKPFEKAPKGILPQVMASRYMHVLDEVGVKASLIGWDGR